MKKVPDCVACYESQIERDFYLLLEHSDDVKIYQPQPKEIRFKTIDGKPKNYFPDCYIEFFDGRKLMVELKDIKTYITKYDKFEEKWKAGEKWCRKHGILFSVLTDDEIRSSRLSNIWFTLGSSKIQVSNDEITRLMKILAS